MYLFLIIFLIQYLRVACFPFWINIENTSENIITVAVLLSEPHISQESEHHLESQNSMWETIDFYQPGKWNERENDIAGHREFSSGQQRLSFMGIGQKLQMLLG